MGSVADKLRTNDSVTLPSHFPVNHTCDACSARAVYEVRLASGKNLIFCGHHTNRHMDALVVQGAVVFPLENE